MTIGGAKESPVSYRRIFLTTTPRLLVILTTHSKIALHLEGYLMRGTELLFYQFAIVQLKYFVGLAGDF
jgi:hypothetical protein